jgi:pimeloyl-ACP methyl ester carboxylesterase
MSNHFKGDDPVSAAMHEVGLASLDGAPIRTFHTDLVADRPTIVLALPFGLRHAAAQSFYAALSDRFNIVTWESRFVMNFDDRPDAETISTDMHAGDLVAIIDHYDLGPADVVGYCSGAGITLLAAAKHPERFRRLVLVSGEYMLPPAQYRQTSFQREVSVLLPAAATSPADAAMLHEKITAGRVKPTHEFHEFVSLPFSSPEHLYRFGLNYLAYRNLDMLDTARSVRHEALLIATRHDAQVTVESAEIVSRHLPASRDVVVVDGDHYQLCRGDPDILTELVKFLA